MSDRTEKEELAYQEGLKRGREEGSDSVKDVGDEAYKQGLLRSTELINEWLKDDDMDVPQLLETIRKEAEGGE